MKLRYILLILTLFSISCLNAQTFEEFKKQRESEFNSFKQKQQEYIDQMKKEFEEYVIQQDAQFSKYLEERWKAFEIMAGEKPPNIPKPIDEPVFVPDQAPVKRNNTTQLDNPLLIFENGKARPLIPLKSESETGKDENSLVIDIDFYGNSLSFEIDKDNVIKAPQTVNEGAISNYWKQFSSKDNSSLLYQLQNYKSILNLNDWAYYILLDKLSEKVYEESQIGAELFSWSMLTRSGYKARIGYSGNKASILLPSYNTIYSTEFLKSDGLTYYIINSLGAANVMTYDKDYPGAVGTFDFNISRPLNFNINEGSKTLSFGYKGEEYSFSINYNKNVVDFYRDYPQVDIDVYFNAAVSLTTKQSLLEVLSKEVADMTETEAVGFILRFVQTAFQYEVDNKQFNKEKFLFPEETIYYTASDCEDRSVLFAYLIGEILNLKVIGLQYPGHISTAVKADNSVLGDKVTFNGENYIIADATYENAPLGLAMPQFANETPKVIIINNPVLNNNLTDSYWNQAAASGGYRGARLNDIVINNDSSAYLTGYFVDTANFDGFKLETSDKNNTRATFVIKYDKNQKAEWVRQISGSKNVTAYMMVKDDAGDIYISGTFNGDIDISNKDRLSCKENQSDVFIARLSANGQVQWIRKAGLDTYPQDNYFTYSISFTKDGVNKGIAFYSEEEFNPDFGLFFDKKGLLNIRGSYMNSTGFGINKYALSTASMEELEVFKSLKELNDQLINEAYEKTIAGLFSVVNHVKLDGFKMLGTDAQKTLDKYNPEFKDKYPDIYEGISEINFVQNNDGIVIVETNKKKTVILRELKIKNNAKFKITPFQDGNAQLDMLEGVQVGKFFIWFDLNFAKLQKENGDILFDFDSDHTQKLMNLKEDILD